MRRRLGKRNPTSSAPPDADGDTLTEILTLVKEQSQMLAKWDARQEEQGRVQQEQGRMLAAIDTRQQEQGGVQDEQGGTLAMLSRHFGVLVENSARMQRVFRNDDERLCSRVYIFTVDELLRFCSLARFPADKESLLRGVVSLHSVKDSLFMAVEQRMQAEATARDVVLPAHPGHTPADMARWLKQARLLLLKARPKGKGKPAWLDACDGLVAYAESAASSRQLAFLAQEEQGGLVLLLLGAAATGELVECLEMGGEPVLHFTKEGLHLDLLEVKADADAIRNAVRQLQRQANILLLALALSNAAALEQGPLHVVATVEVAGEVPKPQFVKYWESRQLLVGGVGPAPKVPMRLRIRH